MRSHLFASRNANGDVVAGLPNDFGFGDPDPDAAKVRAGTYPKRHWKVAYEYDFGDSWGHTVELKEVVALDEKFTRRLLDGARCPRPRTAVACPATTVQQFLPVYQKA